jgi:CHAT domain-containing protein/Tfp pilus assembly protein PilF
MGLYGQAEPVFRRALAIQERTLSPDHPDLATSLNNLAGVYRAMGSYAQAEPLYRKALHIKERTLPPDHPDVAASLNNLARLQQDLGAYLEAEPLYRRALRIWETSLGPDHPDVATSLDNLAGLYQDMGSYSQAQALYEKALAVRERALGGFHPDVGTSLNNLAHLHHVTGSHARSEPLYRRSIEVWKRSLGEDHALVATGLHNLAVLCAGRGEYGEARVLFRQAQSIDEKHIGYVIGWASEEGQLDFLATKRKGLEGFLSLIAWHLPHEPGASRDGLEVWLKRKGIILESQRRFQEALISANEPEVAAAFQELARVRARLSHLVFGRFHGQGKATFRDELAMLEGRKRELETRLGDLSRTFGLKRKTEEAGVEDVASAMPEGTALLEFARVNRFDFRAQDPQKRWLPARYLAFVLRAGKGSSVGLVDLGEAQRIDRSIADFKKEIARLTEMNEKRIASLSRALHDLVFQPLRAQIAGSKELYVSPDGNLNLIPFEVLMGEEGRYLIEDYSFNYLAAARDIARFGEISGEPGKAVLMGDPDFDMGKEERQKVFARLATKGRGAPREGGFSSELKGVWFESLPGTREEVAAIRDLMGNRAELYSGEEALEEVLREKVSPSILHLATHGFFMRDLEGIGSEEAVFRGVDAVSISGFPRKGGIENPLLRSGVALAGANRAIASEESRTSEGILTAEEILGLRLQGTDLVVLSACETGLGEVRTGEGVYGLRRAFLQAGAKSLVMSMWAVPDRETKELMIEFYRRATSGGMNRCQALRHAALNQMKIVKERYGHANPYYWGAFVFMGEP